MHDWGKVHPRSMTDLTLMSTGQGPSQQLLGRQQPAGAVPFNARVADRHATEDGSQYLHLILGADSRNPAGTIDAEFLFLSGDAGVRPLGMLDIAAACPAPKHVNRRLL